MKRQMLCTERLFRSLFTFFAVVVFAAAGPVMAQTNSTSSISTNVPGWITQPLSVVDALDLTLRQNSGLQKARADLEASRGLVIQTRAVALPTVTAAGKYTREDQGLIQKFPGVNATFPDESCQPAFKLSKPFIRAAGRCPPSARRACRKSSLFFNIRQLWRTRCWPPELRITMCW